jgi:hypothetical protein
MFCYAFVYGTNHYNNKGFTRDLLFQLSSEAILPARKKMRMKRGSKNRSEGLSIGELNAGE